MRLAGNEIYYYQFAIADEREGGVDEVFERIGEVKEKMEKVFEGIGRVRQRSEKVKKDVELMKHLIEG